MSRIKLQFVQAFIDRHGHVRHYFRRGGDKRVPLPGLPGSEEFMAAYAAALASVPDTKSAEIGAKRTLAGTVNALVVSYYRSAEWTGLNSGTQHNRRAHIEQFRAEHGDKRLVLLQREHIERMMAKVPNVHARRTWLQAIRALLPSAIPLMLKTNPADGIKGVRIPKTKGYHTWTDDEIQQYRDYWPLGTQRRLVMEFALEAVSRRSEVVRLGPQHIKNGRIRIERVHGSKPVDIPVTPELQAACDAMPKGNALYMVTMYGKPFTAKGLGNAFPKWAAEAGLPDICRMHGLKKGGMRRLAESGATGHEIMAISGHHKLAMVELYTADADRKKLADSGMKKRIAND
jgi:site-specific recombinase XerC